MTGEEAKELARLNGNNVSVVTSNGCVFKGPVPENIELYAKENDLQVFYMNPELKPESITKKSKSKNGA